jgi:hypothetical protein
MKYISLCRNKAQQNTLKIIKQYRMGEEEEEEQWRDWTGLSTIYLQVKYQGKIP